MPTTPETHKVVFPCARISWPAFDCDYGHVPEYAVDIDPTVTARIDIWRCSVSEDHPDGYFVSTQDINDASTIEPGDHSNDKHLLCRIAFYGVPSITMIGTQGELDSKAHRRYQVIYWNRRLPVQPDESELCPPPAIVDDSYTTDRAPALDEDLTDTMSNIPTVIPLEAESTPSHLANPAKPANAFAAETAKMQK